MSFHTCDASCSGFQDHMTNLAESDDGVNWSLVPNFIPYNGSVPDVIIRANKLYIYTPGGVKRYDKNLNWWDTNPVPVSIVDGNGNPVMYVDPSAIIDSSGNIVLFFLNSTGLTGDPAGCNGNYPCIKYFDSAIETSGSDGTQFVMQSGHRASITLNNSPQTASDPDIYFDGQDYILYISQGSSTLAYWCQSMHGSYQSFIIFPSNVLTNVGGIPCGYFDSSTNQYWTYVHANISGNTVIQQKTHINFNSQLTNFITVMSGPIIGQPSSTKTESPGFCVNDFLSGVNETDQQKVISIFPNPFSETAIISVSNAEFLSSDLKMKLYDVYGRLIANVKLTTQNTQFAKGLFSAGMYFYKVEKKNKILQTGKIAID